MDILLFLGLLKRATTLIPKPKNSRIPSRPAIILFNHWAIPHNGIWIPSTLNDLLMSTPALFTWNYTGICIQQPEKGMRVWLHTFMLHLLKYFQCIPPLSAFHMSQYQGVPSDHISRWHLVEHSPSILHTPTFWIHVNKATAQKTSDSKPLWMIYSWTWLPSLSTPKPEHALITGTKVDCWDSFLLVAFDGKAASPIQVAHPWHISNNYLLHEKMFNRTVPGSITAISAAPRVGVISCQARELAVSSYVSSYVWILVAFHFPTTRNPYQANQPWIFHIPGINAIVRAQNATDFLHQQVNFVTAHCI